jgi:hypothetical protein
MTLGRCDFCYKPAVVRFSRQSWYNSRGHRRALTLNYRSCAEHESCPAWLSILDLYTDAAAKAVRLPADVRATLGDRP